jgi:hypothetical protein
MSNTLQLSPGILTIHCTTNPCLISTHTQIPAQTIRLKYVRCEFSTSADALATKVAYVDLPFLGAQALVDQRENYYHLPLLLDNSQVTTYQTDLPFQIAKSIQERFNVRVLNEAGLLAPNLVSVTLQFSFDLNLV